MLAETKNLAVASNIAWLPSFINWVSILGAGFLTMETGESLFPWRRVIYKEHKMITCLDYHLSFPILVRVGWYCPILLPCVNVFITIWIIRIWIDTWLSWLYIDTILVHDKMTSTENCLSYVQWRKRTRM